LFYGCIDATYIEGGYGKDVIISVKSIGVEGGLLLLGWDRG